MPDVLEMVTGYPALLAFCFFCGLGIPLPEDVPQVWAGIQIASGQMGWVPAIAACIAAVFARDAVFFGAGRLLGERAFGSAVAVRLIGESRIEAARDRVRERGPMAVLIGRFMVGFRISTFFVAGAMGVRPRDFALWDGLGLLLSVPLLVGLGYLVGEPVVLGVMQLASSMRWLVPVAVVAALGIWWFWFRPRPAAES